MVAEQVLDVLVPQMVEQSLEVPKIIHQDRILQRTVKQIVDRSEAKRTDFAEAEKNLATLLAYQAVSNRSCIQVAPDHEDYVKAYAEKLKVLADATQMIQSETCGAEGQTDSLFQESSGASLQTSTDLEGLKVVTMVRRLAAQEQSAALAQLTARVSGIIMKFGADTGDDPFVKVKGLVMSLISRLQDESLSQASQKACCSEEASNATGKRKISKPMLQSTLPNLMQLWPDPSFWTGRFRRFSQSWVYCQTGNCILTSCVQLNGTFSPKSKLTLSKAFRECRRHLRPFGNTR